MTWGVTYHGGPLHGRMEAREVLPPEILRHPIAPRCRVDMYDPNDNGTIDHLEYCEYQRVTPPVGATVVHYNYVDPDSFEGVMRTLRRRIDEAMFDIFVDAGEAITEPQEPAVITVDNMRALMERISEERYYLRVPIDPMFPYEMRAGIGGPVTARGGLTVDQAAYDVRPDICWRCDAVEATTDVGLCGNCRDDLTGDE